jgi:hypothetical protein
MDAPPSRRRTAATSTPKTVQLAAPKEFATLKLSCGRYNPDMSRVRRVLRCAICSSEPTLSEGRWVCQCAKFQWQPEKGCEGTPEDRKLLERYGWRLASDAGGFTFWIAPGNAGVIYLYADGTWSGGLAGFASLDDYLEWNASSKLTQPSPK